MVSRAGRGGFTVGESKCLTALRLTCFIWGVRLRRFAQPDFEGDVLCLSSFLESSIQLVPDGTLLFHSL